MELRAFAYELPLRHTFRISRGAMDSQSTLIVALEQDGKTGWGEATTNEYYGYTLKNMTDALRRISSTIAESDCEDPAELFVTIQQQIPDNPFALCALDQAAHDLWGKLHGKPVYAMWGLSNETVPTSNYTIGIDEIDTMVDKMREFADWPIFKIKLGTDRDVEIVRALREQTDAVFRVDANGAWTADQTIEYSEPLRELGVEFIEQPLHADHVADMPRVYQHSALPLIADENCIVPSDVAQCVGRFHGVNIKLVKCGGLTPARQMIDEARKSGLKVMVGCMTESTVGISAIAQLLPMLDYVDMDGAVLLADDIARGARVEKGKCIYPTLAGSGVELLDNDLVRGGVRLL